MAADENNFLVKFHHLTPILTAARPSPPEDPCDWGLQQSVVEAGEIDA